MPDTLELSSPMLSQYPSNTRSRPPHKRKMVTPLSIFLSKNPSVILALVGGLLCTFACFSFTLWLSREVLDCPHWAVNCTVDPTVEWIVQHYGLVQGIVAALSGIGIATMSYAAFQLGETTLWPILHRQWLTLDEVATHISASRGSIPSLFRALASIRSMEALSTILCVAIIIGTHQANSIVVGQVYTRTQVPTPYESNHSVGGGGLDGSFLQSNPPRAVPLGISTAASLYSSWSFESSDEPLGKYRDYIFDRRKFDTLGLTDFVISAVKVQRNITCDGFPVKISNDTDIDSRLFSVDTNQNSGSVQLRSERRTAVWVDNIKYIDSTRTISTLVFAALDGNIEKGVNTKTTKPMQTADQHIDSISAVACSVDVTLLDNQHVGNNSSDDGAQPATISSLDTIKGPDADTDSNSSSSSSSSPLGEVAAWLGVSVTSFGVSTRGAQPMFESPERYPNANSQLPKAYNLAQPNNDANPGDNWTLAEIEHFITVGSGAVAMSIAINDKGRGNYTLVRSTQEAPRLKSSGAYVLLYLAVPVVVVFFLQAGLTVWIHRNEDVPAFHTADVPQIVVGSRALEMQKLLYEAESEKDITSLKVKYKRLSEGPMEFGLYAVH